MINDEYHVALPKLYGAPAYARPPRPVEEAVPRPLDPDDLPLEAFREEDDPVVLVASGADPDRAGGNGSGNGSVTGADDAPSLEGHPFSLRTLSRFISGR